MAPLLENKDGVRIHVQSKEHLPPHIHVFSGDDEALIVIRTGEIHEGFIPGKKLKIVKKWLAEGDNRELTERNFYELNPRLAPKAGEDKKKSEKLLKKKKVKKKGG